MIIKMPFIATRYSFIINELNSYVADVAIKIKNFFLVCNELAGQGDLQHYCFLMI